VNRKAQITIFIILGVVLLMATGIALLFRTEMAKLWVEEVTMWHLALRQQQGTE
jgi:hypothetical protein